MSVVSPIILASQMQKLRLREIRGFAHVTQLVDGEAEAGTQII